MNDFSGKARLANMSVVDGIFLVKSLCSIGENKVLVLDYGTLYRDLDPAFKRHRSDRQPVPSRPIRNIGRPVNGVLDLAIYKLQVDQTAEYLGTFQEVVPGGSGLTGQATVQALAKWMLSSRTQIARTSLNKDTGFWEAYLPTLAPSKGVNISAKSFLQPTPWTFVGSKEEKRLLGCRSIIDLLNEINSWANQKRLSYATMCEAIFTAFIPRKTNQLSCYTDTPYFDACFYKAKYHVLRLAFVAIFGFVYDKVNQMITLTRVELEGNNFKLSPKYFAQVLSYIFPMGVQH
jgi:hypothetical protein